MKLLWVALCGVVLMRGDDPHTRVVLENEYARVVLVTYGAHEKSPEHEHSAVPVVYVYTSDGGPMRFTHEGGPSILRRQVARGQVRFARGAAEKHTVENLSGEENRYLRVELKTKPADLPESDVRMEPGDAEYEGKMIRISRRPARVARYPAVDVTYEGERAVFVAKGEGAAGADLRVELKTGLKKR